MVRGAVLRWALATRGRTLGVRALALDAGGRVLLVRHTYTAGWHLPGGGVDVGESVGAAAVRELREETGVEPLGKPELFGLYLQRIVPGRDHIALYVVRSVRPGVAVSNDDEIAEVRWVSCDNLPADATPGTRARIAEVLDGAPVSPFW